MQPSDQICADCAQCAIPGPGCTSAAHRHCNACRHCETYHLRAPAEAFRQEVRGRFVEQTTWGQPMLEPQLWVGGPRAHAPASERFNAIQNAPDWAAKPKGGLWTSTYVPTRGSAWTEWCVAEDFNVPHSGWASWVLYPTRDLQVLHIETYADLKEVVESEYGHDAPWRTEIFGGDQPRWLNFERLAEIYDAIHLTEEGQWATRLSHPHTLYGWDCESTCWLHWGGIEWERTQSLGTVRWGQSGPVTPEPPKAQRLRGPRRRL